MRSRYARRNTSCFRSFGWRSASVMASKSHTRSCGEPVLPSNSDAFSEMSIQTAKSGGPSLAKNAFKVKNYICIFFNWRSWKEFVNAITLQEPFRWKIFEDRGNKCTLVVVKNEDRPSLDLGSKQLPLQPIGIHPPHLSGLCASTGAHVDPLQGVATFRHELPQCNLTAVSFRQM